MCESELAQYVCLHYTLRQLYILNPLVSAILPKIVSFDSHVTRSE